MVYISLCYLEPPCKDALVNCDAYRSQCFSTKMKTFLRTYCKLACGYCGKFLLLGKNSQPFWRFPVSKLQRYIWNPAEHLRWVFFAEILNG